MSKTKVAPLSSTTIPRLELCGTLLVSKLLSTVMEALDIPLESVYAWTDSSIVLGWINTPPQKLSIFISHRVSEITTLVSVSEITTLVSPRQWKHIPTQDNPADVASRGLPPSDLVCNTLWWFGPQWLNRPPEEWPMRTDLYTTEELPETKSVVMTVVFSGTEEFAARFSSFIRMLRTAAWCLCFTRIVRLKLETLPQNLELWEIEGPKIIYSASVNSNTSKWRFWLSQKGRTCLPQALCPTEDLSRMIKAFFVLGVDYRGRTSTYPKGTLSFCIGKSRLTRLLDIHLHVTNQHAGPTTLLGIASSSYHFVGAKYLVRDVSVACKKAYCRATQQIMGQLSPYRTTPG